MSDSTQRVPWRQPSPLQVFRSVRRLSPLDLAEIAVTASTPHEAFLERTQIAAGISLCEAGLLPPDDGRLRDLFRQLYVRGVPDLVATQRRWVANHCDGGAAA